jgi:glycosyltransferase involved in cell wall biosynthesis
MANVSVVIPTYQCEQYISQSIDSVLAQTFKDYEIIIIDDGSTDNTQELLRKYSKMRNIKIFSQSNQGPAAARNLGIRMSSGEFIAFLDADDIWLPNKLEKQITFLEKHPLIDLVYCDSYIFNEKCTRQRTLFDISRPFSGKALEELFLSDFIPLLTVVVRRSIFNTVGFFDETVIGPEDYDLWLRICQTKPIDFIHEPLAKYRVSSRQILEQRIKRLENEIKVKEKALRNVPGLLILPTSSLDQGYYNLLIRIAKLSLQNNHNKESRKFLEKYKLQRGITLRYLAMRTILLFPNAFQRLMLFVWDFIRRKRGL